MSVPPDIMELLQGGGAPPAPAPGSAPAPAAGGLPPDIMDLLGGAGAEGDDDPGVPSITDGNPGDGEQALVAAIDMLQVAIDAEADQEDIQVLLQCQTKMQQILAKNQAEQDSMLQGKASPRGMRRAVRAAY